MSEKPKPKPGNEEMLRELDAIVRRHGLGDDPELVELYRRLFGKEPPKSARNVDG